MNWEFGNIAEFKRNELRQLKECAVMFMREHEEDPAGSCGAGSYRRMKRLNLLSLQASKITAGNLSQERIRPF